MNLLAEIIWELGKKPPPRSRVQKFVDGCVNWSFVAVLVSVPCLAVWKIIDIAIWMLS